MPRKLTHDEHVAAITKVNPNVEVLGEIKGSNVKVLCRCKVCDHKWCATPNSLKNEHGCPECAKPKMGQGRKLSHVEHVAAINKVNPEIEVLGEIINNRAKVLCRCKVCNHEWSAAPRILKSGCGCPECGKKKQGGRRLSHEEHVAVIIRVNHDVEVLEEIKEGIKQKVLCRCKSCGHKWTARVGGLKEGKGCPECRKLKIAQKLTWSHEKWVNAVARVNPNIEILEKITNGDTKVLCCCKKCNHKWGSTPHRLKLGDGCPRCAKHGFQSHDIGKLYVMVDDLNVPTMMKIGVSVNEDERSKTVLRSAHKAGVSIPTLYVAKTWEGPTDLMQRIEQMMHENYAEWNIKFSAKFDGCTEFFYYNPETAGVFDAIDETYYTVVNQF